MSQLPAPARSSAASSSCRTSAGSTAPMYCERLTPPSFQKAYQYGPWGQLVQP